MANTIKHKIGLKRVIYWRMKRGVTDLTTRHFELAMKVKNDVRNTKRNYEIRIGNHAKDDPKSFFQIYDTKARDSLGPSGQMMENEKQCYFFGLKVFKWVKGIKKDDLDEVLI